VSTVTATQFFDQELPRLFSEKKARTKRNADVIFEVAGPSGGRWRVRLAQPPEVSSLSAHDETGDLLIRMDASEFSSFLDGTLDVVQAVDEGRLALAGDLSLVEELAEMWSTPKSWLSLRVEESGK
jgi:alkyl sulfatase BDS1-like metallo-beta-lactamase superfamily hydrolase